MPMQETKSHECLLTLNFVSLLYYHHLSVHILLKLENVEETKTMVYLKI